MKKSWVCLILLLGVGCATEMPRGSERRLYTIASQLQVYSEDLGKEILLTMDQELLFKIKLDPSRPGQWELKGYDQRMLMLMSETPRLPEEHWGVLLKAKSQGDSELVLEFTPSGESAVPEKFHMPVTVRR